MISLFYDYLQSLERIDSLTGAFNSRYFGCWLEELYEDKREFHVINVDIANHKKINLVFGNRFKFASLYRNISSALIDMGCKAVAVGVETVPELALLQKWNIDYIQGYYFSKPVSEKAIIDVLNDGNASSAAEAAGQSAEILLT